MGYLKVDITRLSFAEVWRWRNPAAFLAFTVRKLLRSPFYGPVLIPDTPGLVRIPLEDLSQGVRDGLQANVADLAARGFDVVFYYKTGTVGPSEGAAAATRHFSGASVCMAAFSSTAGLAEAGISVVSRVAGGQIVATGNLRSTFDPPPGVSIVRLPGQSVAAVIAVHEGRAAEAGVLPIAADGVEAFILELEQLALTHYVRRGLYVPAG
jgi:hypothetical protein